MNEPLFPLREMTWWQEVIAPFGRPLVVSSNEYDFYEINGDIYCVPHKEEEEKTA